MYLNQKAKWLPVTSKNSYGDFKYSDSPKIIDVRRQEHVEEIRTADGTIHHTNFIYYVNADVHVDDKLDDNLVVALYDMNTLSGVRRLRRLKTI